MSAALHINDTPVVRLGNAMMGVPDGQTDIEGEKPAVKTGGIAVERLRSLVQRIERLEEERKTLGEDIKDIYKECAGAGFIPKVVRQAIRIRKQDQAERDEQESLLDLYMQALGD